MSLTMSKIALSLASLTCCTLAFSPSGPGHGLMHSPTIPKSWQVTDVTDSRRHLQKRAQAIHMSNKFSGADMRKNKKPDFRASTLGRREMLLSGAAAALSLWNAKPAAGVVGGTKVSKAEAAQAGVVSLWIDLTNCNICRKGLPGTCTGTLVGPDLVLSAKHCTEVPESLNGTLDKVMFGNNIFAKDVQERKVVKTVSTSDYGIDAEGNDLLLIKLESPAPKEWKQVSLPIQLLPTQAEQKAAEAMNSPFFPDGLGNPQATFYGFGLQDPDGEIDPKKYKDGELKRMEVTVETEVRPWGAGFLAKSDDKKTGICPGDSGGAAMVNLGEPDGSGVRQIALGVNVGAGSPRRGNEALFVNPQYFGDFLLKASKDLKSPLAPGLSWKAYGR